MARHRSPQRSSFFTPFELCAAVVTPSSGSHAAGSVPLSSHARVLLAAVAGSSVALVGHEVAALATSHAQIQLDTSTPADHAAETVIAGPEALSRPDAAGRDRAQADPGAPTNGADLAKASQLELQGGVKVPPTTKTRAAPAAGNKAGPATAPAVTAPTVTAPTAAAPNTTARAATAPAPTAAAPKPASPAPPAAKPAPPAAKPPAVKPPAPAPAAGGFALPVVGRISSGFGGRSGGFHYGLDFAAPIGTPIHAVAGGQVISAGTATGFGLWVRIRHDDGTVTVYGHVNRFFVQVGQRVGTGQVIAEVGNRGQSTGPHLHLEVQLAGGQRVDPRPWLAARGIRV